MHAHKLAVLAVYHGTLTVTEAALKYKVSRQQIYRLLARYRAHTAPPVSNPNPVALTRIRNKREC